VGAAKNEKNDESRFISLISYKYFTKMFLLT